MKNNAIIITVLVAVIAGGGGFFAGMQYQKSQAPSLANRQAGGTRGGQFGGQRAGANGANRPVNGQILSADDKSITVKLQDGSSKIVLISGTTQINKAATATKTDLTTGQMVAVFGTTNSDGSVTAQNIQLNPMMRFGGGSPRPSSTPGY